MNKNIYIRIMTTKIVATIIRRMAWQNFVNITEQQNINNGIRFVENDNSYNKVGIYTIQGVMMKRIPPVRHEESLDLELSDLPKGIYIVNGRKMVNK